MKFHALSLLLFASLLLTSCNKSDTPTSSSSDEEESSSISSSTCEEEESEGGDIVFPIEEDEEEEEEVLHDVNYSIHTDIQLEYLNSKNYTALPDTITGQAENSKPKPIVIEALADGNDLSNASNFKLKLSVNSDMSSPTSYVSETKYFSLINLKIATNYYYTYSYTTPSGDYESDVKEFYVKGEAPRVLDVGGVTNFRDFGGYRIGKSQKRTKQGLVYRSACWHAYHIDDITEEGKQAVKDLGIKTEIDLRQDINGRTQEECVVDGIKYLNYQMDHSKDYFDYEENVVQIKNVINEFANPTNYPISFHCSIGTDRTGFISFILNALLGVKGAEIYHDYMFSNYANINAPREATVIDEYINILTYRYGGATLQKGAANYLDSIGVSQENIIKIKQYLTGEVDPLKA